jgi:hypothetical protein
MKAKLLAILLGLSVMSWAQSATPNPTPAPEQKTAPAEAKHECPCCEKMGAMHDHAAMHDHGAMKDMEGCCMHKDAAAKDGKEAMSCCAGVEGKMACGHETDAKATAKDGKAPASCCAGGKCEGKEMSCCAGEAAHGCCGGNSCGKHEHAEHAAPGN